MCAHVCVCVHVCSTKEELGRYYFLPFGLVLFLPVGLGTVHIETVCVSATQYWLAFFCWTGGDKKPRPAPAKPPPEEKFDNSKYQANELFQYNPMSFYDLEASIATSRCPLPSSIKKASWHSSSQPGFRLWSIRAIVCVFRGTYAITVELVWNSLCLTRMKNHTSVSWWKWTKFGQFFSQKLWMQNISNWCIVLVTSTLMPDPISVTHRGVWTLRLHVVFSQ